MSSVHVFEWKFPTYCTTSSLYYGNNRLYKFSIRSWYCYDLLIGVHAGVWYYEVRRNDSYGVIVMCTILLQVYIDDMPTETNCAMRLGWSQSVGNVLYNMLQLVCIMNQHNG